MIDALGLRAGFRLVDDRVVLPLESKIERPGHTGHLQPKEMAVLLSLAQRPGVVVQRDDIATEVWGARPVAPESLNQKIAALRHHLGDDHHNPRFIQTVPKIGYRLVSDVTPLQTATAIPAPPPASGEQNILSVASRFFADLKQRKVFRIAGLYLVVAWLIIQLANTLADMVPLPSWTEPLTVVLVLLGFPVALVMAYALEVAPDGSVHTAGNEVDNSRTARGIFVVVVALISVAISALTLYWLQEDAPIVAAAEQPAIPVNSIAVLPFKILSASQEDSFLGAGLTEDTRLQLTKLTSLIVAPQLLSDDGLMGSSYAQIAQRLGVSNLLTGTVRTDSNGVRITVSLIDARQEHVIWTNDYNRPAKNLLIGPGDVSSSIALTVAKLLDSNNPGLDPSVPRQTTVSSDAYAHYLQGLDRLGQARSEQTLTQAAAAFIGALTFDDGYASAHAGLCETYLAQFVSTRRTELVALAEKSCLRALELDPDLVAVHVAVGKLHYHQGNYAQAGQNFEKALSIDANLTEAYAGLGNVYTRLGDNINAEISYSSALKLRPYWGAYNDLGGFMLKSGSYVKAVAYFERALQLNNQNQHILNNLGAAYFYVGDFQSAAKAYERSLQIEPSRSAYSNLGTMLYYGGHYAVAAAKYLQAIELTPDDYRVWGNLADTLRFVTQATSPGAMEAYTQAIALAEAQLKVNEKDAATWANLAWYSSNVGDDARAQARLTRALALGPSDPDTMFIAALIYTHGKNVDQALAALAEAKSKGYPLVIIKATPDFDAIRHTPQFNNIVSEP